MAQACLPSPSPSFPLAGLCRWEGLGPTSPCLLLGLAVFWSLPGPSPPPAPAPHTHRALPLTLRSFHHFRCPTPTPGHLRIRTGVTGPSLSPGSVGLVQVCP